MPMRRVRNARCRLYAARLSCLPLPAAIAPIEDSHMADIKLAAHMRFVPGMRCRGLRRNRCANEVVD